MTANIWTANIWTARFWTASLRTTSLGTASLRTIVLAVALLSAAIPVARAQDLSAVLELGINSILQFDTPFETVLIADADIVDVHTRDERSVILEPLNPGSTNLIFLDDRNMVIANVPVVVRSTETMSNALPPASELAVRPY